MQPSFLKAGGRTIDKVGSSPSRKTVLAAFIAFWPGIALRAEDDKFDRRACSVITAYVVKGKRQRKRRCGTYCWRYARDLPATRARMRVRRRLFPTTTAYSDG